jgi:hypothetical protein
MSSAYFPAVGVPEYTVFYAIKTKTISNERKQHNAIKKKKRGK